ncbi:MAG: Protein-L-isoaspartate O-methyltransferase [Legionellaceae bacterium]
MDIEESRRNMITRQVRSWGVLNEDILALLSKVPREIFVPEEYQKVPFADIPLPIAHGQVMLSPKEEGRILQSLAIKPTDKVLEIGTGTGYFTALLATMAKQVYSIDIFPEFISHAQLKLAQLNIQNVTLHCGDGSHGWPEFAPYDVIVMTASMPRLSMEMHQQLSIHGRLFAIIGTDPIMSAQLIIRQQKEAWHTETLFETFTPPLHHF